MEAADIVIIGAGAGAKLVWTSVQGRSVVVVEKGLVAGTARSSPACPARRCCGAPASGGLAANQQFSGLLTGRSEPADAYRQAVARRERIVHGRDDTSAAAALEKTGARLLRGTGRVVRAGVVEVDGTQLAG